MDPHRLTRDELLYELSVRGLQDVGYETVGAMRRQLAEWLRTEDFGALTYDVAYALEPAEDIAVCNTKVTQLLTYVQTRAEIQKGSNEERNVETRLKHLYGRLGRLKKHMQPQEFQTVSVQVNNLLTQLGTIETLLDSKVRNRDDETNVAGPTPLVPIPNIVQVHRSQIPVCQWGLTFSGDKTGLSVNAFLERVEEYRVARAVSEPELLNSAIDLLSGSALIWYRSVRNDCTSWKDLVQKMRKEFLPFDYEDELWAEIRSRYQGSEEPVGNYFACMLNLFNRLPTPPSEVERLKVLQRNLAPYLIQGLGLTNVDNVDQLLETCKRLEVTKKLAAAPRTTPSRHSLLESDLADPTRPARSKTWSAQVSAVACWNCSSTGHRFATCPKPRDRIFCFGCGKQGVVRARCSCREKSKAQSGNARGNL